MFIRAKSTSCCSSTPPSLKRRRWAFPDSFSGEAVKSFVVLRPSASLSVEELHDYCRKSLVKYKVPTRVEFVDALPRSGVGKINKLELKSRG